jgi:hypothetical protein
MIETFSDFLKSQPRYYHRDGTPIQTGDGTADTLIWAELFEDSKGRTIGNEKTLYGERLSTVWLGMDQGWGGGPPLIFETMLFAPDPTKIMRRYFSSIARAFSEGEESGDDDLKAEADAYAAHIKRNFPHNQLQLRYSSEDEARHRHITLRLQCLIPPRWRHFLFWTVGQDPTWRFYDDDDEE